MRYAGWSWPYGPLYCLLAVLSLGALGCASQASYPVMRTIGGKRTLGTFVPPHAYEWFIRGELARGRGDHAKARAAYERARSATEDPLLVARLAETYEALGAQEQADTLLDQGLERWPAAEALWLARGRIAEGRAESDGALRAYARASAAAPGSALGPMAGFELLRRMGARERAETWLTEFVERSEGQPSEGRSVTALRARLAIANSQGEGARAVELIRAILRESPARQRELLRTAETALEAGAPLLALQLLGAIAPVPESRHLQVRAWLAAGRPEQAIALLDAYSVDDFGGLLGAAELNLKAARAKRAEELASAAVAAQDRPEARGLRGRALLQQTRWLEAARELGLVPVGSSVEAETRAALGTALLAEGMQALAAEVLSTAGHRGSDDVAWELRERLAALRAARGEPDEALAVFGTATMQTRGAPLEAQESWQKSRWLERLGQDSQARALLRGLSKSASTLPPPGAARVQGEVLAEGGQVARAAKVLMEASRTAPDDVSLALRAAELLYASGQRQGAQRLAKELLWLTTIQPFVARLRVLLADPT